MGIQLDCRSNLCAFADGDLLYVGHYRGGMSIIDLKKKTTRRMLHDPSVPQSLPGHSVYSLYKDRLGHLWVGTEWGWDYWIHLPGALLCFGMCRGVFHLWWLIVFMIFVKRQTGSFGLLVMSVVSVFWI